VRVIGVNDKGTKQAVSGAAITLMWEDANGKSRAENYTEKDVPITAKLLQDGKSRLR
jgi:hypothetical protein